jgi:hypothetical protein
MTPPITFKQIEERTVAQGLLGRYDTLEEGRSLYNNIDGQTVIQCVAIVTFRYAEHLRLIQMEIYEDATFRLGVSTCPGDRAMLRAAARAHDFVETMEIQDRV